MILKDKYPDKPSGIREKLYNLLGFYTADKQPKTDEMGDVSSHDELMSFLDLSVVEYNDLEDNRHKKETVLEQLKSKPTVSEILKKLMAPDLSEDTFSDLLDQLNEKFDSRNQELGSSRRSSLYFNLPCGADMRIDFYHELNNLLVFCGSYPSDDDDIDVPKNNQEYKKYSGEQELLPPLGWTKRRNRSTNA